MSGHGRLVVAACDEEPDDAAGGVVAGVVADEPDGAVIDGVVVADEPVDAVATVTPSPRARPTELPTIAAATNTRLCFMVLLRGSHGPWRGPVWATGPPRSTRP
jgi:hypothetical protein